MDIAHGNNFAQRRLIGNFIARTNEKSIGDRPGIFITPEWIRFYGEQ